MPWKILVNYFKYDFVVGVLERETNMAAPYMISFFKNNLIFTDPYLCCERHSCSKMLLSCVVFPTQQA